MIKLFVCIYLSNFIVIYINEPLTVIVHTLHVNRAISTPLQTPLPQSLYYFINTNFIQSPKSITDGHMIKMKTKNISTNKLIPIINSI